MRPQPKRMGSNRNMMTTMQPPKNKLQSLADDFVRSSIVTALQQQGGASGVVSRNIIPVAPAADPVSNLLAAAGVAHPGALGRMPPARTVSAKGIGGHVAAASPLPPKQQQQQTPKLTSTMIRAKLLSASSRNLATRRSFDQTESTVDSEIDEVAAAAGVNLRKVQSLGELSVSSTSTQENMNKLATSQRQLSSAGLARLRATLR
ncbi:expressed unknown protein [Seminavis robusta]|uniref:Uncharacterized protein n=1 Tax=Seminavis robusta TaxID=568900 RepID=A0A9N8ERE6_9STRA|nr:expressed unknown protein [Seminavis robusta]|eukprot:Sro1733_g294230.1 n/a (205) ;mRNA; r:5416-6030